MQKGMKTFLLQQEILERMDDMASDIYPNVVHSLLNCCVVVGSWYQLKNFYFTRDSICIYERSCKERNRPSNQTLVLFVRNNFRVFIILVVFFFAFVHRLFQHFQQLMAFAQVRHHDTLSLWYGTVNAYKFTILP